jgi:hypothetical protein
MTVTATRSVRIRVSLAQAKYIGEVEIPGGVDRMSDLLNGRSPFLALRNVDSYESIRKDSAFIINKEHIDYVQVLEEQPLIEANKIPGQFHRIRVKTLSADILGELFVPQTGETPMDVVSDDRAFLSIRDAEIVGTHERYQFLGISKGKICTVEVFEKH